METKHIEYLKFYVVLLSLTVSIQHTKCATTASMPTLLTDYTLIILPYDVI